MHRTLYSNHTAKMAIEGILHRGLRNGMSFPLPKQKRNLEIQAELGLDPTWITSVVEYLREANIWLMRGGIWMNNTPDANLLPFLRGRASNGSISNIANGDMVSLVQTNLRTIDDTRGSHDDRWRLPIQCMKDQEETFDSTNWQGIATTKPGQFWMKDDPIYKSVLIEILGTMEQQFVTRKWIRANPLQEGPLQIGDEMSIDKESISRGGGSDQRMYYTDIFPARYCSEEEGEIKLVQMSNDYFKHNRVLTKILGVVNHSSPYCGTKGDWADRVNSDLERYDQTHEDNDTSDLSSLYGGEFNATFMTISLFS